MLFFEQIGFYQFLSDKAITKKHPCWGVFWAKCKDNLASEAICCATSDSCLRMIGCTYSPATCAV